MTSMAPNPSKVINGATSAPLKAAEVLLFKMVDVLFMLRPLATPGAEDDVELATGAATTDPCDCDPLVSCACMAALKAPVKPVMVNLRR